VKLLSILIIGILINAGSLAQTRNATTPFIIQGSIINCSAKEIILKYKDENYSIVSDTARIDSTGSFFLKTYKLKIPQRINIDQAGLLIANLFIAPGYNLTIRGDASSFEMFSKTKSITGIGAKSNTYSKILDSIYASHKDSIPFFRLIKKDFILYINNAIKLNDSVAKTVFDAKWNPDVYAKYFKKLVVFENTITKLFFLTQHVNNNNYSYEESVSIVKENINTKIYNSIFKDEYLISDNYKKTISGEYLNYLVDLDFKKDSTLRRKKGYTLEVANTFKGKVREYVLYKLMSSGIEDASSFEKLTAYEELSKKYLSSLANSTYANEIDNKILNKKSALIKIQVGKPAPLFVLESSEGKQYSLSEFVGKVVYIDLWASWCGPCRAENPFMKKLYEKYADNEKVMFIGIAVWDKSKNWKEALKVDEPGWLQLIDKNDTIARDYFTSWIPRFIIIDKAGKIVNFDAPRPSSESEIEKLIEMEIAR
jgi:thiol-disulfide isomerase/thioredoxin